MAGSSSASAPTTSSIFRSASPATTCCMTTRTARSAASISTAPAPKWWRSAFATVGFDWHPETKQLYFTDNGRDWLSESVPEDELNRVTKVGEHFGAPYCYQATCSMPISAGPLLQRVTAPVSLMGLHTRALGMRFLHRQHVPEGLQRTPSSSRATARGTSRKRKAATWSPSSSQQGWHDEIDGPFLTGFDNQLYGCRSMCCR